MAVSILRGGTRRFIFRALLGRIFLVYLLMWHLCSFNTYVTFDSQQSRAERWPISSAVVFACIINMNAGTRCARECAAWSVMRTGTSLRMCMSDFL